jgi:hypothetical protein
MPLNQINLNNKNYLFFIIHEVYHMYLLIRFILNLNFQLSIINIVYFINYIKILYNNLHITIDYQISLNKILNFFFLNLHSYYLYHQIFNLLFIILAVIYDFNYLNQSMILNLIIFYKKLIIYLIISVIIYHYHLNNIHEFNSFYNRVQIRMLFLYIKLRIYIIKIQF